MLWLALSYVGVGILFMGLAVPLIFKSVKPNPWYGFRTPKTLRDPDIWYPANAYSGVWMFLAGGVTALAAILLALIPGIQEETYACSMTAVMMLSLLWAVVLSFQYLKKL